jgi:hypothetical protein
MAKDPAFLFYSSDFLTGTMFMTNEQVGLYIRMLAAQHQHGGRIDTNVLRIECNRITNGDTVFNKFIHDDSGSYSERLNEEMEKRKEKSLKASESIKKRWNKHKYESNTNVLRSVNENVNENRDVIIDNTTNVVAKKIESNHPLIQHINSNYPNIRKLKNQLTDEQADELIATFGKQAIADILEAMENYGKLKNYKSVYLTAKQWLKKAKQYERTSTKQKPSFTEGISNWLNEVS